MDEKLSWISLDYHLSVNDEFDYIDGSSAIALETDDGDELITKKIGYIHFHIYNTNCFVDWVDFIDAADSISGDELFLIENFIESGIINFGIEKVLCLDTIKIEQEYRSNGYGSLAIKDLIKFCGVLGLDYIILQPAPIEGEAFNEQRPKRIARIKQFYENLNFEVYQPSKGEPIMILQI